jgi:hypothetical protein
VGLDSVRRMWMVRDAVLHAFNWQQSQRKTLNALPASIRTDAPGLAENIEATGVLTETEIISALDFLIPSGYASTDASYWDDQGVDYYIDPYGRYIPTSLGSGTGYEITEKGQRVVSNLRSVSDPDGPAQYHQEPSNSFLTNHPRPI